MPLSFQSEWPFKEPPTILLVDDEPQVLALFRRLLRPYPIQLLTVESVDAAIPILENQPIHILLVDYRMPEFIGVSLCQMVKQNWPMTVSIMTTGQLDLSSAEERVGSDLVFDFLVKPCDEQELLLTICSALEEWVLPVQREHLHQQVELLGEKEKVVRQEIEGKNQQRIKHLVLSQKIIEKRHREFRLVTNLLKILVDGGERSSPLSSLVHEIQRLVRCDEVLFSPEIVQAANPYIDGSSLVIPLNIFEGFSLGSLILNRRGEVFSEDDLKIVKELLDVILLTCTHSYIRKEKDQVFQDWEVTFDSVYFPMFMAEGAGKIRKINHALVELLQPHPDAVIGKRLEVIHSHLKEIGGFSGKRFFLPKRKKTNPFIIEIFNDVREEGRLKSSLRQAEQLAAVGRLASQIIQPLHQAFGEMSSLAQLLKEDFSPDDPAQEDLKMVGEVTRQCQTLINNLLESSPQKEPRPPRTIDLNALLIDTLQSLEEPIVSQKIQVTTALTEGLPGIFGDQYELQQVLLNFLINAIQAMKTGGVLSVETVPGGEHSVYIAIRDSGDGISPSNLPRIFDPFFTTKKQNGGKGLGLTIAHSVINDHGGTVTVASEPGKGSTFTISLPQAGGKA